MFASILNAHAPQAERRARLLRVVPLVLVLHLLAVVALSRDWREPAPLPVRARDDDALVLKLLTALPALPSAVAAAARPVQAAPRRVVARKGPPRLKLAPLPAPAPQVEESPPGDTSKAEGEAVSPGAALDSAEDVPVGGGVGGVLGGVLSSGVPAPPPLTAEEREALMERYMEKLIDDRFERVRYPHLAAAAGITGEVSLRATINSRGQLLKLELIGRCPHPVLCDSAQETVRNAEPFPPPPPELGNPCVLEMPFRYRLR